MLLYILRRPMLFSVWAILRVSLASAVSRMHWLAPFGGPRAAGRAHDQCWSVLLGPLPLPDEMVRANVVCTWTDLDHAAAHHHAV